MSVEQIEQQIQRLPATEVIRPAQWFNGFLAAQTSTPAAADEDWLETRDLVAELDRRLAEFTANPVIAAPLEPDEANLRWFPHAVFYQMIGDCPVVFAVIHAKCEHGPILAGRRSTA